MSNPSGVFINLGTVVLVDWAWQSQGWASDCPKLQRQQQQQKGLRCWFSAGHIHSLFNCKNYIKPLS